MNVKIFPIIFALLLISILSNISASCNEGQININSASAIELDDLYGIGSVKAQAIINARPFGSLEDLINVKGIGEKTLNKIKEQGIACVDSENEDKNKTKIEQTEIKNKTQTISETQKETIKNGVETNNQEPKITTLDVIMLNKNTKDIKSSGINKKLSKESYAIYAFIGFCILIIFLFALKFAKRRKYKNDFF